MKNSQKLQTFRKKIDSIDEGIQKLLSKRAELVNEIAKFKKEHSLKTLDKNREIEILKKFKNPFEKAVFKKILIESKKQQRTLNEK